MHHSFAQQGDRWTDKDQKPGRSHSVRVPRCGSTATPGGGVLYEMAGHRGGCTEKSCVNEGLSRITALGWILCICLSGLTIAAEPQGNPGTPRPATDALGRNLPLSQDVGPVRDRKSV